MVRRYTSLFSILVIIIVGFSCLKTAKPYDMRPLGASASDLLNDAQYKKVVIEIQYMDQYKVDSQVMRDVADFLKKVCDKQDGISFVQTQIKPTERTETLSVNDVIKMEKKYRTRYTSGNAIAIYVLITNGHAAVDYVAGFAYYNTSMVIYGKTIADLNFKGNQRPYVFEHELGHLLGLVNSGSFDLIPHEDSMHVRHCNNPNCAMNFAAGKNELDSNCLFDLQCQKTGFNTQAKVSFK